MPQNIRPLLRADIKVTAEETGEHLDTVVYARSRDGYQFYGVPPEIRGKSFDDTLQTFYNQGNHILCQDPQLGELTFEVTGVQYGTVLDTLENKPLATVSLEEYMHNKMPKNIPTQ